MKCVIPCAGKGTRMGGSTPKPLIRIGGVTILERIKQQWRGVVDGFVVIVSPENKRAIRTYCNPEDTEFAVQKNPKGLAGAILQAEPYVNGKFIINLGDCLFRGKFEEKDFDLGIGVWETYDLIEINKNYQTLTWGGTVVQLIEKPSLANVGARNCGMGVYFMDTKVFSYIRKYRGASGGGDFTSVLQDMIDAGEEIAPIWFKGKYINVGSPEDIKKAEELFR
jgi:NDP-sugar pyrophosphorylase family protein